MENISEPTLPLLEKLPERMQEKKTRKAGTDVPILILISAASLTLYSPNLPLVILISAASLTLYSPNSPL
jgi:hypothetical protein